MGLIKVARRFLEVTSIELEASELSRYLLDVGLPVQLAVTLVYTTPGADPPLPVPVLRVIVPCVIIAGFAPFLRLSSYIVRLTVVAGRTADTLPFSSRLSKTVSVPKEHQRP